MCQCMRFSNFSEDQQVMINFNQQVIIACYKWVMDFTSMTCNNIFWNFQNRGPPLKKVVGLNTGIQQCESDIMWHYLKIKTVRISSAPHSVTRKRLSKGLSTMCEKWSCIWICPCTFQKLLIVMMSCIKYYLPIWQIRFCVHSSLACLFEVEPSVQRYLTRK